ncbi:hypothetical protein QR685DRAFT_2259 [Neurospora intermedia]|uniref:Uncharacterized protein n=1 Tax=Neurospora intermedia TaxID=5142 RepID=A0ABR3DNJ0_NEUIN
MQRIKRLLPVPVSSPAPAPVRPIGASDSPTTASRHQPVPSPLPARVPDPMLRVGDYLVRTISRVLVLVQSSHCLGPSVPSSSSSLCRLSRLRPSGLVSPIASYLLLLLLLLLSFFSLFCPSGIRLVVLDSSSPGSLVRTTKSLLRDLALSHADEPMKYLLASACTTTTTTTTLVQKH